MIADVLHIVLRALYWVLLPCVLLRFAMQWRRIPFQNPLGRFVMAVTDWVVKPLRKIFVGRGGVDWASLIAAALLELLFLLLPRLLLMQWGFNAPVLLVQMVFGLLLTMITLLIVVLIVCAILSWVQADSPVRDMLDALINPLVRPIRRRLPLVGGVDLSPLVLIVLLQIVSVLLLHAQATILVALR
jgi:YggT family protein